MYHCFQKWTAAGCWWIGIWSHRKMSFGDLKSHGYSYLSFNKNCSTKITCLAIFSIPNKQSCVFYWRSKYLYFLASNTFLIWQGEKRTQGIILNNTLLLFAFIILYIRCLFLWQFLMSKKLWCQGFSLLHNWWIF